MWDPGNSSRFGPGLGSQRSVPHCPIQTASRQLGFTLLELLLVVAIIAIASAGVGFALREQDETQLEREGQRLVALLESARAQSRATGLPVYWRAEARGFAFVGLAPVAPPADAAPMDLDGADQPALTPWLADGLTVEDGAALMLGPEPIIAPQQVVLLLGERSLRIATDGLRPFAVRAAGPEQPSEPP